MSYAPSSEPWAALFPIGSFTDDTWPFVFSEHEKVYTTHNSLVSSGLGVMPATANDTTKTANCRWVVFRNTDNLQLMIRLRGTATSSDCTITLDYGGATATGTLPAGSTVVREISVIPTSSMAGGTTYREAVLSHTCGAGGTVKIENVTAYLVPVGTIGDAGGLAHGSSSSGFVRAPEATDLVNDTNDRAISTERLQRVINGPIQIAKDRPQSVGSLIRHTEDRELGTSSKTEWVTVARGILNVLAPAPTDLRAFYHIKSTTGGSPLSRFVWFGDLQSAVSQAGTGWKQATIADVVANNATLQNPELSFAPWALQAKVESSGSGLVFCDSVQLFRDPKL